MDWWGHSAAGNVMSLPSRTYQYNAENLLTQETTVGSSATYTYDGDGRRITKSVVPATTVYVYDAFGQLVAEYGGTAAAGTQYLLTDALGLDSCHRELGRHGIETV